MVSFLYIAVGLLALFLIQKLVVHIRLARLRRKHGCKLENRISQVERILGLDIYFTQMNAHKEHRLLDVAISRYRKYGNTWSATMIGMVSSFLIAIWFSCLYFIEILQYYRPRECQNYSGHQFQGLWTRTQGRILEAITRQRYLHYWYDFYIYN
jgi:hypothetical protein